MADLIVHVLLAVSCTMNAIGLIVLIRSERRRMEFIRTIRDSLEDSSARQERGETFH